MADRARAVEDEAWYPTAKPRSAHQTGTRKECIDAVGNGRKLSQLDHEAGIEIGRYGIWSSGRERLGIYV